MIHWEDVVWRALTHWQDILQMYIECLHSTFYSSTSLIRRPDINILFWCFCDILQMCKVNIPYTFWFVGRRCAFWLGKSYQWLYSSSLTYQLTASTCLDRQIWTWQKSLTMTWSQLLARQNHDIISSLEWLQWGRTLSVSTGGLGPYSWGVSEK